VHPSGVDVAGRVARRGAYSSVGAREARRLAEAVVDIARRQRARIDDREQIALAVILELRKLEGRISQRREAVELVVGLARHAAQRVFDLDSVADHDGHERMTAARYLLHARLELGELRRAYYPARRPRDHPLKARHRKGKRFSEIDPPILVVLRPAELRVDV